MAGVKGAKWERPLSASPTHAAAVRERIKTSQLVEALQKHALGEKDMLPTQVQAANILLRKVIADKSESDVTIRKVESLSEEQSRQMAEAMIESARASATLCPPQPDRVHDSV